MNKGDFLIIMFFGFATGACAGHELHGRDLANGQALYAEL